jgi:hypothetical protein
MSTASLLLTEYETAISAVLNAQAYTFNNRSVTKADLATLEKGRDKYKKEVAQETRGGFRVGGITCVDSK